jgi:hypothetical protein
VEGSPAHVRLLNRSCDLGGRGWIGNADVVLRSRGPSARLTYDPVLARQTEHDLLRESRGFFKLAEPVIMHMTT